ncbi:MAG: amidohydrolase family protein [Candidatus Poribacteria bacterium]|nr:amidohydrolase family protein [Candidatus Poribacteria bacterium]
MNSFPIVDTHVHLWHPEHLRYPWLDEVPAIRKPHLLDDFRAACGDASVESFVFVECDVHPDERVREAEWVASLAKQEPRIKGIVASAPLEDGEGARAVLEDLAGNPLVKGIRRLIQAESLDFCLQPGFIRGVQLLNEYGLSFDICIVDSQLANVIEFVKQCPNNQFMLDHIGKPNIKNDVFQPWAREIEMLSQFPNVFCKVSGVATSADFERWKPADLKPYINHVIGCFGFDRVAYGGDWPVSTQAIGYSQWVETLVWAVDGCSKDEMKKLFRENAMRFYRLGE